MNTFLLRSVASTCSLAVLLLLGGCESGQAETDLPEPSHESTVAAQAAIEERISEYVDVLTVHRDAQLAEDFYTEDARLLGPGIDLDRQAVVDGIRSVLDAGTQVEVNRETLELFVHDDAAYEMAQAEDIFISQDGAVADTTRNNLFIRWEREDDGRWRFDRVVLGPQNAN